ncbi:hypothetical protein AVEN_168988-1 [Araneus ventricosus]|uniref:Uncharacterized protein n=1 Tax=Araneus ventricosus TaxID=182803 RepID=A0A4Y2KFT1_ARAVE|nr:hypothetical protein AVEN_168988-1 [Araneus ventricosus]
MPRSGRPFTALFLPGWAWDCLKNGEGTDGWDTYRNDASLRHPQADTFLGRINQLRNIYAAPSCTVFFLRQSLSGPFILDRDDCFGFAYWGSSL